MRSGRPSRSEIASRIRMPGREQSHALGVELEAIGHLRDRRAGQHADAALERLVLQLRAHEPAQRGGGAADRHGAGGGWRLEALERPLHVAAHLLELVHRGRVGAQVRVGQKAGADPKRLRPGHLAVGARRWRSRWSRRPRRSRRPCRRAPRAACAWRPRRTAAPPPRRTGRSARRRRPPRRRPPARRGCRRCGWPRSQRPRCARRPPRAPRRSGCARPRRSPRSSPPGSAPPS